jgi:cytochrome b561
MNTSSSLSLTTVLLHWSVALFIVGLTMAGVLMVNAEVWFLYPWHKSLGVVACALIVLRMYWRWREGFPAPLGDEFLVAIKTRKYNVATIVHSVLLLAALLMPISGMVFSGMSGHGFSVFGLTLIPSNPDPLEVNNVVPHHAGIAEAAQSIHHYLGYLLLLLLALHVAAALKHHFIDRDDVLRRMLGKTVPTLAKASTELDREV